MKDMTWRASLIKTMEKDKAWLDYWTNMECNHVVGMEFYEKMRDAWKHGYAQGKGALDE